MSGNGRRKIKSIPAPRPAAAASSSVRAPLSSSTSSSTSSSASKPKKSRKRKSSELEDVRGSSSSGSISDSSTDSITLVDDTMMAHEWDRARQGWQQYADYLNEVNKEIMGEDWVASSNIPTRSQSV